MNGNDFLMSAPRFTARFDSECLSCDSAIYEGEEAGYVENEVCCALCCEDAEGDCD